MRGAGIAVAAAYLLYPALGFMNRFDFHPEVAATPLFLFAILNFEKKKPAWGYLLTLLALVSKEQMGLVIAAWGVSLLLFRKEWLRGALFLLVGLGWSYFALFHIIPHFRGAPSDTLIRYEHLADTPGGLLAVLLQEPGTILSRFFSTPLRLQYLWRLFFPLVGLCFLCPRILMIALPVLAYNLLSENINQHTIYYHYNEAAIPWLFWSAIEGLAWLRSGRWSVRRIPQSIREIVVRVWLWALPLGCLTAFMLYNPFLTPVQPPHFEVYGWETVDNAPWIRQAAALIPSQAELTTTMGLAPHFTHRRRIHLWWGGAHLDSDYILLNLYDERWGTTFEEMVQGLEKAMTHHGHRVIFFENGVVLTENERRKKDATQEAKDHIQREQKRRAGDSPIDLEWNTQSGEFEILYGSGRVRGLQSGNEHQMFPDAKSLVDFELSGQYGGAFGLERKGRVLVQNSAEHLGDSMRPLSVFVDMEITQDGAGYYLLDAFGRVYAFGSAQHWGDDRQHSENGRAVDLELSPDGDGYVILRSHGKVVSFGNAQISLPIPRFGWDIARGLLLTGSDSGYLLDGFGGLHEFGDAPPRLCDAYAEVDRMLDLESDPDGNIWILDETGRIHPTRTTLESFVESAILSP